MYDTVHNRALVTAIDVEEDNIRLRALVLSLKRERLIWMLSCGVFFLLLVYFGGRCNAFGS